MLILRVLPHIAHNLMLLIQKVIAIVSKINIFVASIANIVVVAVKAIIIIITTTIAVIIKNVITEVWTETNLNSMMVFQSSKYLYLEKFY